MKSLLARLLALAMAVSTPLLAAQQAVPANRMGATPVVTDQAARAVPGPGEVQPLNNPMGISPDYRIGPNDLIEIEVFGVPDLKRTVRVNSSGMISLALVGNVKVAGMTAQDAEQMIAKAYGEKYLQDPHVSLFIKEFTTQRITVEGAVTRPGIYPVTGQITLLRALALAGGGAKYADMSQIMVFRGNAEQQIYDVDAIRKGDQPDPVIQADDVVVVNRSAARTALRDSLFRDILDSINPFSGFTGSGN
jgi:polysaccharide biosynthesis/export protein